MASKYLVGMAFMAGGRQLKRGSYISGKVAEKFKNFDALLATGYLVSVKEDVKTPVVIESTEEESK